jgi:hypothetical protein
VQLNRQLGGAERLFESLESGREASNMRRLLLLLLLLLLVFLLMELRIRALVQNSIFYILPLAYTRKPQIIQISNTRYTLTPKSI